MDIAELRQKSKEELKEMVKEWQEKLRQLQFDLKAGKLKNVKDIKKTKKEIARMLTLINSNNKNEK